MPTPRRASENRASVKRPSVRKQPHARSDANAKAGGLLAIARSLPRGIDIAIIAVIVVAIIAFAALRPGCSGLESTPDPTAPAYVSPYDWSGLDRANGRYSYSENGESASRLGIDVSDHQGSIDWNAVASDDIEFAFIRIGYRGYTDGDLFDDETYAANIDGAEAAGIDTGVYYFSQATTPEEAVEEAEFVLARLAGRYLPLPVVYDHEPIAGEDGRANDLSSDEVSACAKAFCERIEEGGYSTMIYGNAADIARYSGDAIGNRPVWFAEYDVDVPTGQFDFSVWQYANDGTVAGISTNVDMNILFTTAPQEVR